MDYTRHYGSKGLKKIECTDYRYQLYRVRWDYQDYKDEHIPSDNMISFVEGHFKHKPTIDEVKECILAWFNHNIDQDIYSGFTWNGMNIWLSTENQFNYKAAYDLAVQTNGANLPITFKFGTTEEPNYHTFTTIDELQDFYVKAMAHVNTKLNEGWAKKDSFDWSEYEAELAS